MSLGRRGKRNSKKRARKAAKRVNTQLKEALANMPEKCSTCDKRLDNKDKELLSEWQIQVWPDGTAKLACPGCHSAQNQK